MKRIAAFILLSAMLLSGCGVIPKIITSSDGQAPTPVEEIITPVPTDLPAPTSTAEPQLTPTVAAPTEPVKPSILAYIALNGNVMLKDLSTGADQPLTSDATTAQDPQISYYTPLWSSDGQLLAYQRLSAKAVSWGLEYTFGLWVYDLNSATAREVLTNTQTAGYAWRPGTHTLSYALLTAPDYFTARGVVDATKANGIWAVDADSAAAPFELVPPSGGFSLVEPHWSANGNIVAFDEVMMMEGRGNFAFYDMAAQKYTSRGAQVGGYDLFADGARLVYDMMTYMANGTERIWASNLDGSAAVRISPDYTEGYAFGAQLSPDNSQVAYWKGQTAPQDPPVNQYELYVQPVTETQNPTSYGIISSPVTLAWLPDGATLLLSVGEPGHREIGTISLGNPTFNKITDGDSPALRP